MRIVTHNGSFHPDDVFGVAALRLHLKGESIEVVRSRDPEAIRSADYVVDVGAAYDGERLFDHHQGGIPPRENGIPYASFGLVWKRFGEGLAGGAEAAAEIDKLLVQYIDAKDNGVDIVRSLYGDVYPYTFFDYIKSFKPTWKEDASHIDEAFLRMVGFAEGVLVRELKVLADEREGRRKVEEAYEASEDKRLIVLDRYYPWEEVLSSRPEPLMVVYPGLMSGDWHVQVTRDDINAFVNRIDFPAEWAGLREDELPRATGVPDARFCHVGRFFAAAGSREGAVRLAELAIERARGAQG